MNYLFAAEFLRTFCGGVLLGLGYDIIVMCVFRQWRSLANVFFWAATPVVVIVCLQTASSMELRAYHFGGLIIGWLVYYKLACPGVRAMCDALTCFLDKLTQKVLSPFVKMAEKFALKRKNTIIKINLAAEGLKKMPQKLKNDYNKYAEYFFKGKNNEPKKEKKQ
ncbi:MAG: hypothetical protein GX061_02625 [Eubacteriaceae bacterium]|nr:hypothetical protein [Eubacteriaceae bacterium]